jgi:hypothetical protein
MTAITPASEATTSETTLRTVTVPLVLKDAKPRVSHYHEVKADDARHAGVIIILANAVLEQAGVMGMQNLTLTVAASTLEDKPGLVFNPPIEAPKPIPTPAEAEAEMARFQQSVEVADAARADAEAPTEAEVTEVAQADAELAKVAFEEANIEADTKAANTEAPKAKAKAKAKQD